MGTEAIHSVDIAVELDATGEAVFTEVWDITVLQGTEWHLRLYDLGPMHVSNFTVSDETGLTYSSASSSELREEGTLQEKAGKCYSERVREEDGYELWWGIGSYGRHTYTVTYTLRNFVRVYDECAGFARTFLNDPTDIPVEKASVTLRPAEGSALYPTLALSEENTDVYGAAYEGTVELRDGAIVAQSSAPVGVDDAFVLAARFDRELFEQRGKKVNDSFFSEAYSVSTGYLITTTEGVQRITAEAGDADVHSVDIEVTIGQNGDVRVAETWDMTMHSGTGWYTSLAGNCRVEEYTDVSVQSGDGTQYIYENELPEEEQTWTRYRTPADKTGRCMADDRMGTQCVRIQWGVASPGRQTFTVRYTVPLAVLGLQDADTLELAFLDVRPTGPVAQATLRVGLEQGMLTDQNTQAWAAGYDGKLVFEAGAVRAVTTQRLPWDGSMSIALALEKGLAPVPKNTAAHKLNASLLTTYQEASSTLTSLGGAGGSVTTQEKFRTSTYSPSAEKRTVS